MAQPYLTYINRPKGSLHIKDAGNNFFKIAFSPAKELTNLPDSTKQRSWHIADLNSKTKTFTIYPFKITVTGMVEARYYTLKDITVDTLLRENYALSEDDVEAILEMDVPNAFTKDYNFGLGFRKEYRQIVNMLEQIGIEHLYIKNLEPTSINLANKEAVFNTLDLDNITRRLDRISQKARKVANDIKNQTVIELFTQLLKGKKVVNNETKLGLELIKQIKQSNHLSRNAAWSAESQTMQEISSNSSKILKNNPAGLVKLHNEIETVSLEALIQKFEQMLEQNVSESRWQKMMEQNPFIINMAFGSPVVKIQDQAYIGGRKISGQGEKITDFLFKNITTNNAAIVEIKKPGTRLLAGKSYRKNIYAPSSELVAAMNQVIDQIYNFAKSIANIKENSRIADLETYSVTGYLIIGRSVVDVDQNKSFELFRGNSKNIQILTFDEMLTKLKLLLNFLKPGKVIVPTKNTATLPTDTEELPF